MRTEIHKSGFKNQNGGRAPSRLLRVYLLLLSCAVLTLNSSPAAAQSQPGDEQFLFAYKLLQRGENQLAGEAFDEYLNDYPRADKRGDALYYRALVHQRAGENEAAARLLNNELEPTLVPMWAVQLLRGQVLNELERWSAALEALERIDVRALEPGVATSVHYLRGLAYRGAGNLSAAARELAAAAQQGGEMQGRSLVELARVQVLLNEQQAAVATLRQAMDSSDPATAAEAARLAGDLSYEAGDYDDAARFYGRVIERHQTSQQFGPAVVGVMWAHLDAGRHESVTGTYEQFGSALSPEARAEAAYLAASAEQEGTRHERAVELFNEALRAAPAALRERALYKLAVSQFELGRLDATRQTLEKLLRDFPDTTFAPDAAYLLATADAKSGDAAGGAARLTALIDGRQGDPYYGAALLRRARLYEQQGKKAAAAEDYEQYVEAARSSGDVGREQQTAALRLVALLTELGEVDRAAQAAETLLAQTGLRPDTQQEAMFRLALLRVKQGQAEEALALLDRLGQQYPVHRYRGEAAYYRGLVLMSMGRGDEAEAALAQAGAWEGLDLAMRVNALRLVGMRQRESGRAGDAVATLHEIERLAGVQSLQDGDLVWLARQALEAGDAQASLAYARRVGEGRSGSTPEHRAEAQYLAGLAAAALGRHDEALQSFQHVVAMGRGFEPQARLAAAQSMAAAGRVDEALAEYAGLMNTEASAVAAEAHYQRAKLLRERAQQRLRVDDPRGATLANEEARRVLKRLVLLYPHEELRPLPELAYIELAEVSQSLNEPEQTRAAHRELLAKWPSGDWADYAKAMLAAEQGRLGEAVALLRGLRDVPDDRLRQRVEARLREWEPPR